MMLQCLFKSNSLWFEFTLSLDVHHKNLFSFVETYGRSKVPAYFKKSKVTSEVGSP